MNAKEIKAQELGRLAFLNGKISAAAQDKQVMALLAGNKMGDGQTVKILKAWNNGWHTANLSAEVK